MRNHLCGAKHCVADLVNGALMVVANPMSFIKKSELWGFEVAHILGAFSAMTAVNFACSWFHLPLSLSWGAGIVTLLVLRLLSLGKKAGHLGFLAQWLIEPHVYLGMRRCRAEGGAV